MTKSVCFYVFLPQTLYKNVRAFEQIQYKLHGFIRKYYKNELIKGSILFLSFGLLYFLFTLYIEYFLWLKPTARTFLFWLFVFVELGLLVKYILIPIFKLIGLTSGISPAEASTIIGKHFPEVDDKLLNMLQLHEQNTTRTTRENSELLLASIEQKAATLKPVPFQKAIQFSDNKKKLKYLIIPLFIGLLTYISGKDQVLKESYTRVMHPQKVYVPPAPFHFVVRNNTLEVVEGESIQLQIDTQGDLVPEKVKIIYGQEDYYTNKTASGRFTYELSQLTHDVVFHLRAGEVVSKEYRIKVLPTPKIQGIRMQINYPAYTHSKDETIENTGNAVVPAGTNITWSIHTDKVDSLFFSKTGKRQAFHKTKPDYFRISQRIISNLPYNIQASNAYLENYEDLAFHIEVIADEYPKMQIKTDIDSIRRGNAQFIGQVTDDYGISRLELVYFPQKNPDNKQQYKIPIQGKTQADFYYIFPQHLHLEDGVDYAFYFEVFDNDRVNGSKSTKSKTFSYHKDTDTEAQEKILEEQKENLDALQKNISRQAENRKNLEALRKALQNKTDIEYNDTKKLDDFIKRQEDYQQMMQRQTRALERNLEDLPQTENKSLQEKKEAIKKRIEEAKELAKQEKILEELRKLAEKINREELLDKMEKMSKNNRQKEKSLEQLLELTKRFYVEQKAQQIVEKLQDLAKKQEKLASNPENTKAKQEEMNREFKAIQKEMEALQKENEKLKEPMDIDAQEPEQNAITKEQEQATENLEQQNSSAAQKNQKSAAKKMQKMAQNMQMQMSSLSQEMIEEDIAMLRQIIENLVHFSYNQEDLMLMIKKIDKDHPEFPKKLKEQYRLKSFFEHIDDSLYVLAMRQPKLSQSINKPLADAHYHLDKTLQNFENFAIQKGVSDQHYVMKSANDLALLLSQLLDNMQSSMKMGQGQGQGMGMGKGKGQGKGFSLPDIIQKQGELGEQAKNGMKEGKKPGKNKEGDEGKDGKKGTKGEKGEKGENGKESGNGGQGNGEMDSQQLYEIYKQQALLRQALEKQLEDMQGEGIKAQANKVKNQMEDLERMLLEKGITQQVVDKMLHVNQELLKLKNAAQKQGKENKRESKSNTLNFPRLSPKQIEFKNKYLHKDEILKREVLPFKNSYKKKVQEYFKQE